MPKQPRQKRVRKPLPPAPKAPMHELDAFLENMTDADWEKVRSVNDPQIQAELAAMLERHRVRKTQLRLYSYYPETGPLRRELYHKHMEFYAAGAVHQERSCLGGNRSGKSHLLCYEAACHMVGWYPEWWVGRRFNHPVIVWMAGEDAKAVRDSLQLKMLGPPEAFGTGMIPFDNIIGRPTSRAGVADAVDTFLVKHSSGGMSRGTLKTYDMGRESFQAAAVDIICLDEEPPLPIYTESLTRTLATEPGKQNGILMAGFTPMRGLSQVVLMYLPGGKMDDVAAQK